MSDYSYNGSNIFQLNTVIPTLTTKKKGRVCIDASCTGDSPLVYTWYRRSRSPGEEYLLIDSDSFKDRKCFSDVQSNLKVSIFACVLYVVSEQCTGFQETTNQPLKPTGQHIHTHTHTHVGKYVENMLL